MYSEYNFKENEVDVEVGNKSGNIIILGKGIDKTKK